MSSAVADIHKVLRDVSSKTIDQVAQCLRKYDERLQWLEEWSENALNVINGSRESKNLFFTHLKQERNSESKVLPRSYSNVAHGVYFQPTSTSEQQDTPDERKEPQRNNSEQNLNRTATATSQGEISTAASLSVALGPDQDLMTVSNNEEYSASSIKERKSAEDLLKHGGVLSNNIERFSQIKKKFPSLYSSEGSSENTPNSPNPSLMPRFTRIKSITDSSTISSEKTDSSNNSVTRAVVSEDRKERNPQINYITPQVNSIRLPTAHSNPNDRIIRNKFKRIRSRLNNSNVKLANNFECTCLKQRERRNIPVNLLSYTKVVVETHLLISHIGKKFDQSKLRGQISSSKRITSVNRRKIFKKRVVKQGGPITRKKCAEEMKRQQADDKAKKRKLSLQKRMVEQSKLQRESRMKQCKENLEKLGRKHELKVVAKANSGTKTSAPQNLRQPKAPKRMVEKGKKQRESRMKRCKEHRGKLGREYELKVVAKANSGTETSARQNLRQAKAPKRTAQPKTRDRTSASERTSHPPASKLRKLTYVVSKTSEKVKEKEKDDLVKIGKTSLSVLSSSESSASSNDNASGFVNYDLSELKESDESHTTVKSKPIPSWASGILLKEAVIKQFHHSTLDARAVFGQMPKDFELKTVFNLKRSPYSKRSSSAKWEKTPSGSRFQVRDKLSEAHT